MFNPVQFSYIYTTRGSTLKCLRGSMSYSTSLSKVERAILQPFVLFVLSLSWIYLHVRMWGELCRWHLRPHHCRKIYDCACVVCVCMHVPVCVESEIWNFVAIAWRVSAMFCTERVNFTSLVYCTSHPSFSHFKDSSVSHIQRPCHLKRVFSPPFLD